MIRTHDLNNQGTLIRVTDCFCDWCGNASRREGEHGIHTFMDEANWVVLEGAQDTSGDDDATEPRHYCCRRCLYQASFSDL